MAPHPSWQAWRAEALRTRGSDNGSLIPSSAAAGETGATQVVLAFDDNRLASVLFALPAAYAVLMLS